MESPRSTRHLKRAELAGAPTPTASKRRRRLVFVRGEPLELRPEERRGEPPLALPYPDSPEEKIGVPSESVEIASRDFDSRSSSGPLEPPRSSARSDEDSVDDVAKEKLDVVVVDRQQQAKSLETEASTCNRDFSRETSPSKSATTKPSPAEAPSRAELESFFSAAEERERRRFAEKYNYDVAMDAPLEGRYEWIRLKP